MSHDDVLFGYRLRLFTLAEELGNVSAACRRMGVSRQTYYRLKHQTDRWGIEALRVRERRRPRQANEIGPHLEQRIVAFSLAHPGMGPRRISAELAREKWGGLRISEHGVWRVLRRVGLNTRTKRLALIARHRDPYERAPSPPPPQRHIDASEPGELVQMDCFFIGRLSGSKGSVWQYTAIDVASAYTWAELHSSERNPRSRHCQSLLHRVAHELALAGWKLKTVSTDNGSEFVSSEFGDAVQRHGARQRRIKAGRPDLQRLRRARAANDPRGMLAAELRTLASAQDHRPTPRPRRVPRLLQHRPRAHRPPHTRTPPSRNCLRCPQDGSHTMSTRHHQPGLAHPSAARPAVAAPARRTARGAPARRPRRSRTRPCAAAAASTRAA